ncbi:MAG: hypothetical protein K2Q06_09640, partial [Parvularculaceae bacterium]|nr:hypothetical protein [Parvularculaceae bacterium]
PDGAEGQVSRHQVGGRRHALMPTHPSEPAAALHGHGLIRPWRIAAATAGAATLSLNHEGDVGAFPLAFSSEQTFALAESGLEQILRVKNESRTPGPFGLGLHPFFRRGRRSLLQFRAQRLWRFQVGGGGAEADIPPALDFSAGAVLAEEALDVTFLGFGGAAVIENDGAIVRIESDAPHLHLYAPAQSDFFCLEPVTHAPGAFGADILEPGETLAIRLTIAA